MELISKASAGLDELNETVKLLNSPDGLLQKFLKVVQNADGTVTEMGNVAKEIKQELVITVNKLRI